MFVKNKFSFLFFVGCFFCCGLSFEVYAQEELNENEDDSLRKFNKIEEVIVTSYKSESIKETSLNITSLHIDSLTRYGNFNLTDLLAKTPGVSMLTTGVSIAKPVIRGLYGNRVMVLLSGLRFDNQQWQEEHGLGMSDLGLSKVELIKGPMSVLYGAEAMGGIINVIEEDKPKVGIRENDYSIKFNSNTLGGLIQAGTKVNYGNKWFRIRVGVENNSDYSNGSNQRVLNSRSDGYYLKSTYGFQKKNWTSTNNFFNSFNRFGFIFNDIYEFVTPDARWSRRLNVNPCHLVLLNSVSSENKFVLKSKSKVYFNTGIQSNKRMENEGGGAISLNMLLLTGQYILKFEKNIFNNQKIIISNLGSFENNTNFGSRKIVPDANMQESNISLYHEVKFSKKLVLENGIGIGEKMIHTFLTPTVNTAEKEIAPFTKFSPYYNGYTGLSYNPSEALNIKMNVATGVRVPNLAELSSNGLHEGVFTYEIGDPTMKNEQNISSNFQLGYTKNRVEFSFTPFYNYFINYVYLAPTSEDWFSYPVYRYKQRNVVQYGTEISMVINITERMRFQTAYSGMISQTITGEYTPYIPAQKISSLFYYNFKVKSNRTLNAFVSMDNLFAQDKVAPFEQTTPTYYLINCGMNHSIEKERSILEFNLVVNNLLNEQYYDHLSRLKNFGLYNIGRNIVFSLKVKLKSDTKD